MIRGLAWDVGLPLSAYYLLHLVGATDWVALLAGTLARVLRNRRDLAAEQGA